MGRIAISAAQGAPASDEPSPEAWASIKAAAAAFVARESPDGAWPFEAPRRQELAGRDRKIFPHYFPPLPVSIDGKPWQSDYYGNVYLKRAGEGGKYAAVGGYLRDRPLPAPAASNLDWQYLDAAIEILRARRMGADGFMIDLLQFDPGRYSKLVDVLFRTAAQVDPGFRLVAEPDMAAWMRSPVDKVETVLLDLAPKRSLYRLPDGRILISPFAADLRDVAFWKTLIADMAKAGQPVAFNPVFLDLRHYADFRSFSTGMSMWGPRDPEDVESQLAGIVAKFHAIGESWIMPVAPQDERPKSSIFWEADNTRAYREMWRAAIDQNANGVQLITWNDYGESTQVEPSMGTQFVYYDLAGYYGAWFKTGHAPRILRDALFYNHRRQIVHLGQPAVATDKPMKLLGKTPVENDVEMVAFLTAPATLEIDMNGHVTSQKAEAGLAVLRAPAAPGRPIFRIRRGDKVIVAKTSDQEIEADPDRDDYSYVGGSSTRPYVDVRPS
jgi:hypothetical protein